MKIAINLVSTNIGSGTKTYNINFCNQLIKHKKINNNIYIYICKNYLKFIDKKIYKKPNIKVIIKSDILSNFFLRLIWTQIILPIEIKLKNIQTLVSPMNISPLFIKYMKVNSILALHSNLPWKFFNLMPGNKLKNKITKKFMEISIHNCQKLIVDSENAKKEIKNILNLDKEKINKIYLGIDSKIYKKKNHNKIKNFNYDNKYLLSVISCVRYHNILNLLKAFKKIHYKNKKIKFVLVMQILDKKYFNEIETFIEKNNLQSKVKIFTDLESKYLINLYKKAYLYIFSSYSEVFGYTTIEAMASGCPILVSNTSSLPEINGKAAVYFHPNKINSIVDALNMVLKQKKKRYQLINLGYKRVKRFDIKKNFDETFALIDKNKNINNLIKE